MDKEQGLGKAYSCYGHPTERGVPGWTVPLPAFGRAYLATETFEASPTAREHIGTQVRAHSAVQLAPYNRTHCERARN